MIEFILIAVFFVSGYFIGQGDMYYKCNEMLKHQKKYCKQIKKSNSCLIPYDKFKEENE